MKLRALALACLFALGACAGTQQRLLTYNSGWPDADVYVGADRYQVWFHDTDQTLLVQRGEPRPLGQLAAENLTVYGQDRTPGALWWGAAANAVLQPIGCYGTELNGEGAIREVTYTCPDPVDVGAAVAANRETWRRGVRVPAPPAE